jgi:histidinol dehydrogenase
MSAQREDPLAGRAGAAQPDGLAPQQPQQEGAAAQPADLFAVVAALAGVSAQDRARVFDRGRATDAGVEQAVRELIDDVRVRGDDALRDMALRFDGATLTTLEVPRATCQRSLRELDAGVRAALELAAANIATFHRSQMPEPHEIEPTPGMRLGRRADPLRRVGVYAPGGRASYPSSVLMGVVPAKVAGVSEVIVCSPPGTDGLPPPAVLAACALGGADRVFALGGAGAVAALALGTVSVPRVDKIVGPGNAYVTEAKRQLTGLVAIDSPAGPSEVLIIADHTADPVLLAAEILAQAEHDPDAASVLVTTDAAQCARVSDEVRRLLGEQPRAPIIRAALAARGALLVAADLDEAVAFSESYAPEHLLVMTQDPRALLPRLRAAGTIFLGAPSSVAFGDYITGANHVLPTAGLARAYAGLSAFDFLRWTTYQELSPAAAARMSAPTALLADAEGLPAHALAARLRGADAAADAPPGAAMPAPAAASRPMAQSRTPAAALLRLRPEYRALVPYDPGRTPCETDLSDNTNVFGTAPSVAPLLASLPAATVTRYPAVYVPELKRALADLIGVDPENIATGCGSDDVIDSALRAFCEPGDAVAWAEPTFGMVPVFARMNAARGAPVALGPGFSLDAEALLGRRARITYICRPNNPTGTAFERAAVERVCDGAAGVVLIDEAYADFADDDFAAFAAVSARTLVLRTLSKAYGLAGLRVGFAVGPAALIDEVEKSRGPYKVSGVAAAAALSVLSRDRQWVAERAAEVRQNRERLAAELTRRGVRVWPSAANFVLVGVPGSAAEWNGRLRARGVAARPFPAVPGAGECLRVTVGPWPALERFLAAFDEVLDMVCAA